MTKTPAKWIAFLITLLVAISGCAVRGEDIHDPLPSWDLQELTKRSSVDWGIKASEVTALQILMWNQELDSEGQQIDNVLVWLQLHTETPARYSTNRPDVWVLVSMSRYIGDDKVWRENPRIGYHELPGIRIFKSAPRNEDVYRFLGIGWDFSSNKHFRLLEGVVRQRTWHRVIGEHPSKFHHGEIQIQ